MNNKYALLACPRNHCVRNHMKKLGVVTYDMPSTTSNALDGLLTYKNNAILPNTNSGIAQYLHIIGFNVTHHDTFGGVFSHDKSHLWVSYGGGTTLQYLLPGVKIHDIDIVGHVSKSFLPLENGKLLLFNEAFSDQALKTVSSIYDPDDIIYTTQDICSASISIGNTLITNCEDHVKQLLESEGVRVVCVNETICSSYVHMLS